MSPGPKIHVLGLGNLGRLFAHALATSTQSPAPAVTLLFHRSNLQENWDAAGRRIEITSKNLTSSSSSSNYSVEVIQEDVSKQELHQDEGQIDNLIITTKTLQTVRALRPLAHRLNQNSTLLFAQNGMGTVEEVTASLFSNPATRPRYLAAITSHGVYSTGPFRSVHAGLANVTVGRVEPQTGSGTGNVPQFSLGKGDRESEQTAPMLNAITSAPILSATAVSASSLKFSQLEKLTMNAIINPLTAVLHIKNGELLDHLPVRKFMRRLVEECSQILLALPEIQTDLASKNERNENEKGNESQSEGILTLEQRFNPDRLEALVVDIAQKTAGNTSSMLQDVEAGRQTEIDYINGYIVKRAKEVGINCEAHERLADMVREGISLRVHQLV